MYALIVLVLLAPEAGKLPTMKSQAMLLYTEAQCEQTRTVALTSLPKEWKMISIRSACVRLSNMDNEKGA